MQLQAMEALAGTPVWIVKSASLAGEGLMEMKVTTLGAVSCAETALAARRTRAAMEVSMVGRGEWGRTAAEQHTMTTS